MNTSNPTPEPSGDASQATPDAAAASETPRTDAQTVAHYGDGLGQWVTREFARTLERELTASRAETTKAQEELAAMTRERDNWYGAGIKIAALIVGTVKASGIVDGVEELLQNLATATEQLKEVQQLAESKSSLLLNIADTLRVRGFTAGHSRHLDERVIALAQAYDAAETRARTADAAAAVMREALEHWQHVWKETDCEHDDCMGASDEADKALATDCGIALLAERDKLLGYYTDIVKELGHDLALKTIRELRVDAARLDRLDAITEAYGFEGEHHGNRWVLDGPFKDVRTAIDSLPPCKN